MRRALVGLFCGAMVLVGAPAAGAATISVTTTADTVAADGQCSLREAVLVVDGTPSGDCPISGTGEVAVTLTGERYALAIPATSTDTAASGDLDVAGKLTITGAGAATIIDGAGAKDRIFQVLSGGNLTLKSLTLTGGHAADGAAGTFGAGSPPTNGGPGGTGASGGAIANGGTLSLDHVTVTASQAGDGGAGGMGGTDAAQQTHSGSGGAGGSGGEGGGIVSTGTLSVVDSTISNNRSGNGGTGGLAGGGATNPGVAGNGGVGHEDGGGIAVEGGTATIDRSTISGNAAGSGGNGAAGSYALGSGGRQGGTGGSASWGGGLSFVTATATVSNSTITGNRGGNGGTGGPGSGGGGSGGAGGNGGHGGAIRATNATVTLVRDTIAGNTVGTGGPGGAKDAGSAAVNGASGTTGVGGAIYAESTAPTVSGSIVASNTGGNCFTTGANVTDGGGNIKFGDDSCGTGFLGADPRLGALASNGGPTQTMALGVGSPAIDRGGATCPAVDQRSVARPSGAACDAGAYEVAGPTVATAAVSGVQTTTAVFNGTAIANHAGAAAHFEYGTTTAYGSETPAVAVTGGTTSQLIGAPVSGLAPATTYHVRLVASNADGNTGGADQTFTTLPLPVAIDTRPPIVTPVPTPATPTITALAFAKSTFPAKSVRDKKTKKITKPGTTLTFTLNVPAAVSFTVQRAGVGLKSGTKCGPLPKKPKKGAKHCVLFTKVGTIAVKGVAGANTYAFSGKVGSKVLTKATYVLSGIAKDTAGHTSAAVTAKFKIS